MKPEILFLITARGGSKGVPGKNLKRIGGLSLIAFKAISARKSKFCSRLVISTDDEAIQAEARALDVEVPFTRPADLASDTARSDDVVLHAIDYFETVEKIRYDAIMLLEPASPFARAEDYDAAVETFLRAKATLVVGMRRAPVNSLFIGPLGADGKADRIIGKFADQTRIRRQDVEPEYTMNGALYLIDWDCIKSTGAIYGNPDNAYGHPMDQAHSTEIETLDDLHVAQCLADRGAIDLADWQ